MSAVDTLRAAAVRHQPIFEAAYKDLLTDLGNGPEDERLAWTDLIDPEVIAPGLAPLFIDAWTRAIRAYAMEKGYLDAFQPWQDEEGDTG